MQREQAIALSQVLTQMGDTMFIALTPEMSGQSRAAMLEWARRGGMVQRYHALNCQEWMSDVNPDFKAYYSWRVLPTPEMVGVTGPGGSYSYFKPLESLGNLSEVWVAFTVPSDLNTKVNGVFAVSDKLRMELYVRRRLAHCCREYAQCQRDSVLSALGAGEESS